jgi:hypothetical protein
VSPAEFAKTRPCLCEIDGFEMGMRLRGESPTVEEMTPLWEYKRRMQQGKEMPAPSALKRNWSYQRGRKPTRTR